MRISMLCQPSLAGPMPKLVTPPAGLALAVVPAACELPPEVLPVVVVVLNDPFVNRSTPSMKICTPSSMFSAKANWPSASKNCPVYAQVWFDPHKPDGEPAEVVSPRRG